MHVLHLVAQLALQAVDACVCLLELVLEAEHELDAGEVEAEVGRQLLDQLEPLDVGVRVEARVAGGALRVDEPLLLVDAQRLRVHADDVGGDADHVARAVVHQLSVPELLEQLALLLVQPLRHLELEPCEHVALAAARELRRAAPADAEQLAVLGARGHLQRDGAVRRRHLDRRAERRVGERHRHRHEQVVAPALVGVRRLDVRDDVQVARGRAAVAGLALPLEPDARAVLDAGRDLAPCSASCAARVLCPLHFGHGSSITVPLPRQRGHGCESANRPCDSETTPRPLHSGQMRGDVPGFAPEPWHSEQAVSSSTGTTTSAPRSESSKETCTCASTSEPRCPRCC